MQASSLETSQPARFQRSTAESVAVGAVALCADRGSRQSAEVANCLCVQNEFYSFLEIQKMINMLILVKFLEKYRKEIKL